LERSGSLTDDVLFCRVCARPTSSFSTHRPEGLPELIRVYPCRTAHKWKVSSSWNSTSAKPDPFYRTAHALRERAGGKARDAWSHYSQIANDARNRYVAGGVVW